MKISLSKVVDGYYLAANARRLSKNTIRKYANTFRKFTDFLGDYPPIGDITAGYFWVFLAAQVDSHRDSAEKPLFSDNENHLCQRSIDNR